MVGYWFCLHLHSYMSLQMLRSAEWKILRLKHAKLCELTYFIDDCLCHLLCLTFIMHLYIACVEMHQGIL